MTDTFPSAREATNRLEAFKALDAERDYQEAMTTSADRPDMVENLSIGDHILAMEHCLAEARRLWYSGSAPQRDALDFIRKVGGLSVRCMEHFGVQHRDGRFVEAVRG